MPSFIKTKLSGSTDGRHIKISTTSPVTLHEAVLGTTDWDEVYLWAKCASADYLDAHDLTIELGGTTSPDDLIKITLGQMVGWKNIIPGIPFNGGVLIRAYSSSSSGSPVLFDGYINAVRA